MTINQQIESTEKAIRYYTEMMEKFPDNESMRFAKQEMKEKLMKIKKPKKKNIDKKISEKYYKQRIKEIKERDDTINRLHSEIIRKNKLILNYEKEELINEEIKQSRKRAIDEIEKLKEFAKEETIRADENGRMAISFKNKKVTCINEEGDEKNLTFEELEREYNDLISLFFIRDAELNDVNKEVIYERKQREVCENTIQNLLIRIKNLEGELHLKNNRFTPINQLISENKTAVAEYQDAIVESIMNKSK